MSMHITKIESKVTHKNGRFDIPDQKWEGNYDLIAQDENYLYFRKNNNYGEVPMVTRHSKRDYTFWNGLEEIRFDEHGERI